VRRGRVAAVVAALLLLACPATASADVIFDPADAEELAAVLEEAAEGQDVCYGWDVVVDDAVAGRDTSVGSNFGAGESLDTAGDSCETKVQFTAFITYTSESSESEDSATFDVVSTPRGPTTDDLNNLDLGLDGLTGENVDAVVAKAVAALPLLAADAGVADPIEASPAPEAEAADAQLTDSPGSDFWRRNGNFIWWGGGLLLAGIVFAVYVIRSNRHTRRYATVEEIPPYIPDTVPDDFLEPEPKPAPAAEPEPEAKPAPKPEAAPKTESAPEAKSEPEPEPKRATESTSDKDKE
jgi:outer membrane biosynthesis protein TonB